MNKNNRDNSTTEYKSSNCRECIDGTHLKEEEKCKTCNTTYCKECADRRGKTLTYEGKWVTCPKCGTVKIQKEDWKTRIEQELNKNTGWAIESSICLTCGLEFTGVACPDCE